MPDRAKALYHVSFNLICYFNAIYWLQEVNRIRRYSLIMGYDSILKQMADILRKEVPLLQGVAKQHASYLADCFEE